MEDRTVNLVSGISDNKLDGQTSQRDNFSSTEEIINGKRVSKTWLKQLDDGIRQKLDYPVVIHWTCLILLAAALSGILYSVTEEFFPGSQLFGMFTLFMMSYIGGELTKLVRLPPLLGMLLMGLLLRNTGVIRFSGGYSRAAAILREIALFVILTRAGLGLDPRALKSLSLIILRLAFCPAFIEGTVSMIFTHYLLGLPWLWGALLGAILAAVSPAVVIPCLFSLQERGYGTDKGVPTLVVAAASLDDIFSISAFGVILSVIFSPGSSLLMQILNGPLGVIFGVIFGIIWGIILHYIPHEKDADLVIFRVLLLTAGGLMVIFGSDLIGYPGAGPLGCIVAPFVASLGWKRNGWEAENNRVVSVFGVMWLILQPILFGLIGSEVDVTVLEGGTVGYGILALTCSLLIRIFVSVLIAFGGGFDWKEKIFIAWAWFPKATVQAALGPLPLDKIRENNSSGDDMVYAEKTLIVAVLSILITAPVGAVLISVLGPRLLQSIKNDSQNNPSPIQKMTGCKQETS